MVRPSGRDRHPILFDESSVILPDSVATDYGLSVGDSVQIVVEDKSYTLRITGLCAQYTSKTLYLSFASAAAAGMDTSAHTLLLTLPQGESAGIAAEALAGQDNVKSVGTREDFISRSQDTLKTLNATILILLVSAAMLGMTVIYNITSINIFERTREYATLMVLGYYKSEVNWLILRENMVLTAFGGLLGLPAGYYLFVYLADVISQSNLQIPTGLDPGMVAATLILTFIFALITNLLLRPTIKRIVLVEALKSVE
ncbi:FtsX-like permease family protein [compost metagenome]